MGRHICRHDHTQVKLEPPTDKAESEDTAARFRSYGWNVLKVADGNNLDEIAQAIEQARAQSERPTLIQDRTVLGYGCPRAGTSTAHG